MPRPPRDPERVTVSLYTNKKKQARIGVQFPYSLGMKIATGNTAARDKVIEAVVARVEAQEAGEENE